MRRFFALAALLVMVTALAGCGMSSFGLTTDDVGVHAVAKGGADGASAGKIAIAEGEGLCINHIVNRGSFHVVATSSTGKVVFDEIIKDNVADMVDVQGEFDIEISADKADGTVDVIAYDKKAQAQADGTLDEALKDATGESAEDPGPSSSSASAE